MDTAPTANYRLIARDKQIIPVFKDEVQTIMNWDDDVASPLFTHLERFNSRTERWMTVVAWDPQCAVYADASANIRF